VSLPLARESPERGQAVYTIGGKPTAALGVWETKQGIITNTRIPLRDEDTAFTCVQSDLRINHGNSGGPMVNNHCVLVGVNQSISGAGARIHKGDDGVQIETANIASNHIDVTEALAFVREVVGKDWNGAEPPVLDAPPEKIDELLKVLGSRDPDKRKRAADRLARLGSAGRRAVPALLKLLHDPKVEVADAADSALAAIGPPDKKDLPALIDALQDAKLAKARRYAADALSKLGDAAKPALDALVGACKDEDAFVKARAANALGSFGMEVQDRVHPATGARSPRRGCTPPSA
jgi:hypothetical protein